LLSERDEKCRMMMTHEDIGREEEGEREFFFY
jgi:hypothetical protein